MRLKNCCKKKKDPPMQMKILKNDVLEDLEEEDEDVDDEDAVFKQKSENHEIGRRHLSIDGRNHFKNSHLQEVARDGCILQEG